jgi:hypothetical protein
MVQQAAVSSFINHNYYSDLYKNIPFPGNQGDNTRVADKGKNANQEMEDTTGT